MEPKLPEANSGLEKSPDNYGQRFEQTPLSPSPERGFESGAERVEQRAEATPAAVNSMPVLQPPAYRKILRYRQFPTISL